MSSETIEDIMHSAQRAFRESRYEEAERLYLQATLAPNTHNPQAYYGLGRVLFRQNDLVRAKDYFQTAISQAEGGIYPEAYYYAGNALLRQGECEDAIKYYNTAISQTDGRPYPKAFYALGNAVIDDWKY